MLNLIPTGKEISSASLQFRQASEQLVIVTPAPN